MENRLHRSGAKLYTIRNAYLIKVDGYLKERRKPLALISMIYSLW